MMTVLYVTTMDVIEIERAHICESKNSDISAGLWRNNVRHQFAHPSDLCTLEQRHINRGLGMSCRSRKKDIKVDTRKVARKLKGCVKNYLASEMEGHDFPGCTIRQSQKKDNSKNKHEKAKQPIERRPCR
jgi:hypothetical protein